MKDWTRPCIEGTVSAFLLAAICWYAFGDAGDHGFSFDDENYIATGAAAREDVSYLVDPQLGESWASRIGVHFYAYLVNDWFGQNPRPYHLVNVWVHLLNALLLMRLVRLLQGDRQIAFVAALLFMISSVHFRAVFWISAISFGLGLCFLLIGLLLWVRWHAEEDYPRRWWLLVAAVCAFAVSMLFHQALVIAGLFPALLAVDRGLSRRLQWRLLVAFGLPAIGLFLVERYAYDGAYTGLPDYVLFGWHVLDNLLRYLYALFVGTHINIGFYDEPTWVVLIVGIVILVLTLLLTRRSQTRFWATWTLLALVPFLFWDRADLFSRFFYIPAVGSSVLVAIGLLAVARWFDVRWGGLVAWSAGGILVLGLVGVNVASIDLQQSVQYFDAGRYQLTNENPRGAIYPLKEALRTDPDAPAAVSVWLGAAYMQLGRVHEARSVLMRAKEKYPDSKAVDAMIAESMKPQRSGRR